MSANRGSRQYFLVFHDPSTLKSILPALVTTYLTWRSFTLSHGECYFSIKQVLYLRCLDKPKIMSSTSVKTYFFHSVRLNFWVQCLVHQLSIQEIWLETRISSCFLNVYEHGTSLYFGSFVKGILSLLLSIILGALDSIGAMVFIFKTRICKMT